MNTDQDAAVDFDHLLEFFKVLADESRLRIVGLLAAEPATVGHLAERLALREPTVSHHLARLRALGLVRAEARGTSRVYRLDEDALADLRRHVLEPAGLADLAPQPEDWAARVRETFLRDGRLTRIPATRKKRDVILAWLCESLEPGRRYPEAELNALLAQVHPDTATLRRELIASGFVTRESGVYWLL
jgi:hypothetical protein